MEKNVASSLSPNFTPSEFGITFKKANIYRLFHHQGYPK